jgi:sulfite dehydrogenase
LRREAVIATAWLVALPAGAAEVALTSGPGSTLTTEKCLLCHDGEHIARSRLTRAEWEDNVSIMVRRGMPPIDPAERAVIIDYLVAYYGPAPAPAAGPDTLAAGGADPVANLLTAGACLGCHQPDQAAVGPSFRDVAARYAGKADAVAAVAAQIRNGGSGRWGDVPMPANATLSDADVRTLAEWVLKTP